MSLLDKPVSMNELGKAVVQDIGTVSQRKLSEEKNNLSAVWESMYEKGLQRKVSTQCYFNPEELEIPENAKKGVNLPVTSETVENPSSPKGNEDETLKKNLASVHRERAMNTSRAHWHNEGRHYRRRRTLSRENSKADQ